MFQNLFGSLAPEFAFDIGTNNTTLYLKGRGIVASEPSFVAVQGSEKDRQVHAIGQKAKDLRGRTSKSIQSLSPLQGGAIQDFELATNLLKHFVEMVPRHRRFIKSRAVVSVPSAATAVERRALSEAAEVACAGDTYLVDKTMAAALGAGLEVFAPKGSMIVNIGGGTTNVGVIALGEVLFSQSIKTAGNEFDRCITDYLRRTRHVSIGYETAEHIKLEIGAARAGERERSLTIQGQDMKTALPISIEITQAEVIKALTPALNEIVQSIRLVLDRVPPEVSGDVLENGLVLTGGGALLRDVDMFLSEKVGLPVSMVEDPLTTVVRGAGMILEEWNKYSRLLSKG
ncbi:MAG: rod shape-determining protein [Deltaproteobacteria bacterium]|nr:rod shape-determining protein [Deltaproteobacteria bacterium]